MAESASETEDYKVIEDVQSENENNYVTEELPLQKPASIGEPPVADSDYVHSFASAHLRRIYRIPGNTLRGKNGHIWSTNKTRGSEG